MQREVQFNSNSTAFKSMLTKTSQFCVHVFVKSRTGTGNYCIVVVKMSASLHEQNRLVNRTTDNTNIKGKVLLSGVYSASFGNYMRAIL